MGGYGAKSTRSKGSHYQDTAGLKVDDSAVIEVAEYFINKGLYVAFLHPNGKDPRADLSVEGRHIEVKGLKTLSPNTIEPRISHAFEQVHGDDKRYPPETWREGKVVLLSQHDSKIPVETILHAMQEGYNIAKRKGNVTGKVELWIRGKIIELN